MTYTYISIKVTDDTGFIDALRCTINGFKFGVYFLQMKLSIEACRSEKTVSSHML
jgi:hypothetical protein